MNYGTIDDFLYLTENLSLSLNERVCIARYGHNYRGDKVFFLNASGFSVGSCINEEEGPLMLTLVFDVSTE